VLIGKTQPTDISPARFGVAFSGNKTNQKTTELNPDLVVIDPHMPEKDLLASVEAKSYPTDRPPSFDWHRRVSLL